jgi:quinol-cytochrome oxidoreductase complex cytochrome b subunit
MEGQKAKASKFVLNYGLILGLIMVVLGVVMYVLDYHLQPHWSLTVLSSILFILVVVYGIKAFKKANGGFLSLGEGIKVAVGIALIAAILTGVWTVLLSTVIEPGLTEQAIEIEREKAFEMNPNMTDEQWEKGLEMTEVFRQPWFSFTAILIMYMLFGLIVGLIAGAVMKQKRPYDV